MPYQLRICKSNLQKQTDLQISLPVHSAFSGKECIKRIGPKIWEILPPKIKQLENLEEFIKAIKQSKTASRLPRICKLTSIVSF